MKILLDECVPWPMHKILSGHVCMSARQCGWGGIKNGDLLRQAETEFDLFITSDQNIRYQQNLAGRRSPLLELSSNSIRRLLAAESLIQLAVAALKLADPEREGRKEAQRTPALRFLAPFFHVLPPNRASLVSPL